MPDKIRYPQVPSTVWWGVRAILNRTPNTTVDERLLAIQLGVQEVAARQYIAELNSIGILSDENKATPLALKWRLDSTYQEAVDELITTIYPQSLRDVATPGEGDRQKAVSWFLHEGLGQGAAGNKAATYLMLGSKVPNESPTRSTPARKSGDENGQVAASKRIKQPVVKTKAARQQTDDTSIAKKHHPAGGNADGIPLNVNIQIHISADAGSDQIESIFSAMRRYLYDKQNS